MGAPRLDPARKIFDRDAAQRWRRDADGPVVFTNGVFDGLHRGHAAYLARARAEGGALIVGINSDASARRLGKGPGRPHHGERDRAFLVAALESVDAVVVFAEDTPEALIRALEPDVLAKGADYALEAIVGRETVTARGGRVVRIPVEEGYGTTNLIAKAKGGET